MKTGRKNPSSYSSLPVDIIITKGYFSRRVWWCPVLLTLCLGICGCQSDGGPGLAVRLLDDIFYPFQTHCYARKLKQGTTWTETDRNGRQARRRRKGRPCVGARSCSTGRNAWSTRGRSRNALILNHLPRLCRLLREPSEFERGASEKAIRLGSKISGPIMGLRTIGALIVPCERR